MAQTVLLNWGGASLPFKLISITLDTFPNLTMRVHTTMPGSSTPKELIVPKNASYSNRHHTESTLQATLLLLRLVLMVSGPKIAKEERGVALPHLHLRRVDR